MFNNLLTYGDLIELKLDCNSKKLLEEIKWLNGGIATKLV